MRLKSIKLAGFKSFVDATTVPFSGNLSAVVGPNGCGKSNIIDAVRWVMGESSAKHLRGESMADVIFNGSTGRKPVSQASIELVFDNSEGRMGGEYAQYAEIAVKRQVTREGQSHYFLNGTRCRRKDITQLFLGTGLGPRSYAIIEQGMISRLVEAKPEDLRLFIEEAAGISKYKERRRETELRMRHTRDNLDRLQDLQEELTRQLEKLKQQSRSAEKYQAYRAEEREKRGQCLSMQWQAAKKAHSTAEAQIRELEVKLESLRTQRTRAESQGTQLKTHVQSQQADVQDIQQRYYELGTELAKIEQSLAHTKERQAQLTADLAKTESELEASQAHEAADVEALEAAEAEFDDVAPEYEMASEALEAALDNHSEAEQAQQDWQSNWDVFTRDNYQLQQQAEVAQTKIKQLEETLEQLHGRHDRLKLEKSALDTSELAAEVQQLDGELSRLRDQEHTLEAQLSEETAALQTQRSQNNESANALDEARQGIQEKVGRQSALVALQEAALGRDQTALNTWLENVGLSESPRLAEQLTVAAGWERAVSVVLAEQLQAVCVPGDAEVSAALDAYSDMPGGEVRLADASQAQSGCATGGEFGLRDGAALPSGWSDLATHVQGAGDYLSGIFAAPDWQSAWGNRHLMQAGQSVVTPEGIWIGRDWLVLKPTDNAEDNVLVRQKALQELEAALATAKEEVALLETQLTEGRERLVSLEESATETRRSLKEVHRSVGDVRAQHSAKQERLEQLTARRERIEEEFLEIDGQTQDQHASLTEQRHHLAEIVERMGASEDEREQLKQRETTVRETLRTAKDQVQQTRTRAHELEVQHKTLRTNIDATRTALTRLRNQLNVLLERRTQLQQQMEEQCTPQEDVIVERDRLLTERIAVEESLESAKSVLSTLEYELTTCETQRQEADKALLSEQQGLDALRLKAESSRVESQHFIRQLAEIEEDDMPSAEQILETLPEEASIEQWQKDLELLKNRIARLGPINLAAIDEYRAAQERQDYLNEQQADVESALATLEEAIRKIDKETRDRFKETFDVVNAGLQHLFPKVFGGGSAYLDLTGDDLLETGVAIMARPPGKRNSTIHLLSGGEKALTALALVFAIFQLNPAPFCMLDEVDAPLDDANVGRFCRLVEEMAKDVQFIYITHNKIAMEMAQNLMGVTMNEPGVSRLVAVDVDEAAALAAT